MRSKLLTILLIVLGLSSIGQSRLLLKPNKYLNGLKEGEWSEFDFCDTIDFTGKYRTYWYQAHGNIKYVISEGIYKNGVREGFWKSYWIENYLEDNQKKRKYQIYR